MRRSQTRDDETEGADMTIDPAWGTGSSTAITPSRTSLMTTSRDVHPAMSLAKRFILR